MKLTLRAEWRLWPLSSSFGLLDLKTGVTMALFFALLNKVAGVYGLIAVLTGAGGSFAQLSLYVYSAIALVALGWGLKAIKEEDAKHTLYFAHLYFADHIFSTTWTVFFGVVWWIYTPHDGRRQANSAAQEDMMKVAGATHHISELDRESEAMRIWNHEKGTAVAIIILSWLAKIYFALLLYSYASHLRKGSYRSLHPIRPAASVSAPSVPYAMMEEEVDEVDDFYHVSIRGPTQEGSIPIPAPRTRKFVGSVIEANGFPGTHSEYPVVNGDLHADEVLFDEDDRPPKLDVEGGSYDRTSQPRL